MEHLYFTVVSCQEQRKSILVKLSFLVFLVNSIFVSVPIFYL